MLGSRVTPNLSPFRRSVQGCKMAGVSVVRSTPAPTNQHHLVCSVSTTTMATRRRHRATDNSAKARRSDGYGDWKKKRARYLIGATVSLGAAAAFAREGQLPDVFFDWDNQVKKRTRVGPTGCSKCAVRGTRASCSPTPFSVHLIPQGLEAYGFSS